MPGLCSDEHEAILTARIDGRDPCADNREASGVPGASGRLASAVRFLQSHQLWLGHWVDRMAYEKPQYSLTQVNKAGDVFLNRQEEEDLLHAWRILENWRVAHAYPLNALHMTLRNRARQISIRSLTAQRLKRRTSIFRKLFRGQTRTMQLSQMQDIGGCRAVTQNLRQLNRLVGIYDKRPLQSELTKKRDYITSPKDDGYRSVHLMYRYSGRASSSYWNRLRVEIQIRTKLQHSWATAVETVDAFTGEDLKFGSGSTDWRRFFALVGAAHAQEEGCSPVPFTPSNIRELREELRHLEQSINVIEKLNYYARLTTHLTRTKRKPGDWYLIDMRPEERMSTVYTYSLDRFDEARDELSKKEREYRDTTNQVVLVSAASVQELKRAYPNYFADTKFFVTNLRALL